MDTSSSDPLDDSPSWNTEDMIPPESPYVTEKGETEVIKAKED